MDIKNKLLKVFSGFIEDVDVSDPNNYKITLGDEEGFFLKMDNLKETINSSTTDVSITYVSKALKGIILEETTAKKSISNKDPNFSFLTFKNNKYLDNLSSIYGCIVEFNGTKFFIDKNNGVVDKNENEIKDKGTLSHLKNAIEENFIKTESLLNGEDMVVGIGIAETYEILLNQINGLSNSESIGDHYFNRESETTACKSLEEYLTELEGNDKKFKIDKFNINIEIPLFYTSRFITLSQVLEMADFKRYDKIKEQLEKFIEEKQIDKDDNICRIINNFEGQNIEKDKIETFTRNIEKVFRFVIKRDGKNNTITHAANIVFSGDGKRYLIDSSLAAYEYLFVKDLALNSESERKYNVDLFEIQKIVPGCDLTKIYSVQEGACCKL